MTARPPLAAASDRPDAPVVTLAEQLPHRAAPRREVQHPERARPGRPRQRSLPTVVEFWHDRAA
jgi:hypothetical protein